ncbi:MAG: nucleotide exchange factor GrpE [Hyphomicrobiaceae bacterium]
MSTESDTPKPETPAPEGAAEETPPNDAPDAVNPAPEADVSAEPAADTADETGQEERSGWGKGTIAAVKAALGGDKNADTVADGITKLVEENADVKDRLLRVAAEMENLRKRTEREKADTAKYAVSRFAEDMLRVGDNLTRALESVPEDAEDKDAALKSLRDGIEMTSQELLNGLEKHGVVKDEPKGEAFDPNRHQAIAEIEDAETPAGTIAEVFQVGYMISDRVLRPAMVVVSKGPSMAAPAETQTAEDTTPEAANDDAPETLSETESSANGTDPSAG